MKKILNKINLFFKEVNNIHIEEYTTSCSYYTVLAFIPLIMLILTLTKYFGLDNQIVNLVRANQLSDNILSGTITQIIREVYSKSIGTITISAIFVLWSAGRGFYALCKGLNAAYGLEKTNRTIFYRIRGLICTIIFIAIIILTLILMVFGNKIYLVFKQKFNIFSKIIEILLINRFLISFIFLTIIFTLMYRFIPKHKVRIRKQIPGAIFSAIACNVISIFYSIYVNIFTGFSLMYGSLTTAVLAMMWLYACMYCILIGAVINKEISDK